MGEFLEYFKQKKNLANLLLLGILMLALPIVTEVMRQQQILRSRAQEEPIVFTGDNVKKKSDGTYVALKPQISVSITSPLTSGSQTAQNQGGLVSTVQADEATWYGCAKWSSDNCPDKTKVCVTAGGQAGVLCNVTCTECGSATKTVDQEGKTVINNGDCGGPNSNKPYCDPAGSGQMVPPNGTCTWEACTPANNPTSGTCTLPADINAECTNCILAQKNKGGGDLLNDVKGSNHTLLDPCSAEAITTYWCDSISQEATNECDNIKVGACNSVCGSSTVKGSSVCPGGVDACGDSNYGSLSNSCQQSGGYWSWAAIHPGNVDNGTDFWCRDHAPSGRGWCYKCVGGSQGQAPSSPANLSSSCNSQNGSGSISWAASSNATYYQVYLNPLTNLIRDHYTSTSVQIDAGILTAGTTYTWGVEACNSSGCSSKATSNLVCSAAAIKTTKFRIAETLDQVKAANWQDYKEDGMIVPFDFKDTTPGKKFVFVEFKDSAGNVGGCGENKKKPCSAEIKLLGETPKIEGCLLSFEGGSTILNITGKNFGTDKGKVTSDENELTTRKWKNDSVQAVFPNAPQQGSIDITLTNIDGQTGDGKCNSVSALSLGAKVFCRAPSAHDTDNVDMTLAEAWQGGKKFKKKVSIDKDGIIQGLDQKLETGKHYRLSLKTSKTLRKTVEFDAAEGVTNIPNFVLPVGDIYPLDGGDGTVNALDKAELNREWIIASDATGRSGDFNQDGRVNSIDWACMRYDFGTRDDQEPDAGGPAPTAEPSASASAEPTCQPRPSCLSDTPPCEIPEPGGGWCPK